MYPQFGTFATSMKIWKTINSNFLLTENNYNIIYSSTQGINHKHRHLLLM